MVDRPALHQAGSLTVLNSKYCVCGTNLSSEWELARARQTNEAESDETVTIRFGLVNLIMAGY
jgi:hypothetical protein